jgi:hypothetical protein
MIKDHQEWKNLKIEISLRLKWNHKLKEVDDKLLKLFLKFENENNKDLVWNFF